MLPPRLAVAVRRFWRRTQPVRLGQTRSGLLVAALLLAGWQLSRPAAADTWESGNSQNEYLRLHWYYNLDAGWGHFWFGDEWGDGPTLDFVRFRTHGLPFTTIEADATIPGFGVTPLPNGDYEYGIVGPVYTNFCPGTTVTFPTEGVALWPTTFDYSGVTNSAGVPVVIPPSSLTFVTIRPIAEPASVATLAAGAVLLAAFRRHG